MTHSEKIEYMRIALNIVGFNFKTEDLDQIVSIYDLIKSDKGSSDLESILNIKRDIYKRYESLPEFDNTDN